MSTTDHETRGQTVKIKDVNTTDLLATDRGELARVIMTGQLWKRDSFSRESFPFKHVTGRNTQGRVNTGSYSSYTVGHLVVAHWGTPSDEDLRHLRELKLPELTTDTPQHVQYDRLREFSQQLADNASNLRLFVINTGRAKRWEDAQAQKQAERETQERQYNERLTHQREAVEQFDRLAPALSVYLNQLDYHRGQVGYKAYAGDTPTVPLSLNQLEQLLKDAVLGRERQQNQSD